MFGRKLNSEICIGFKKPVNMVRVFNQYESKNIDTKQDRKSVGRERV